MRQNRQCLVKLWKCQKSASILPREAKALLQLFCLQPIIFEWRQNSLSGAFASWGKIKIQYFTWAVRDWTDDFQQFCGSGQDRIQFYQIRTGLRLKNFTVRSSLNCSLHQALQSSCLFYVSLQVHCIDWLLDDTRPNSFFLS